MRTSTFRLSTTQQIIFALVMALAFTFAGCDTPTNTETVGGPVLVQPPILGRWVGLSEQTGPASDNQTTLEIGDAVGIYTVQDSDGACGGHPLLNKVFSISEIGDNSLSIKILEHRVCGEFQEIGAEQNVFYSLYSDHLRIFDANFVRDGAPR